ncbi:MAG: hypothetical protein KBG15_14355 [Kofleriaceae bacterium]|nr:hypothetical protein [Kofleriaceae bacterium]
MASRLSSMLVRDGIVGVKRLEKAFRRQVVYGGNLDTVLLEMGLIAEERLCQYLALSSGLPPASRVELPFDQLESVRGLLPESLAGKHRVVPLGIEGDAIRVAVHAPIDMAQLEDLADAIDRALQPLIVPEYRRHVWFGRVYGGVPLDRFAVLATELDAYAEVQPVGRAQTVIISEDQPRLRPVTLQPALRKELPVEAAPAQAAPTTASERNSNRRVTLMGLKPARAQTADAVPADFAAVVEEPPYRDTLPPLNVNSTPNNSSAQAALLSVTTEARQRPVVTNAHATLQLPTPTKTPAPAAATKAPARITSAPPIAAAAAVIAAPAAPRAIELPGASTSGPRIAYSELASDRAATEPMLSEIPRMAIAIADAAPPRAMPVASPAAGPGAAASAIPVAVSTLTQSGNANAASAATRASTASLFDEKIAHAGPLSLLAAKQLLLSAEDRDGVFVTLLRAARYRTRFAGLLTVQGGAAIGRFALAEANIDAKAFATVLVPLDMASPFRTAFITRQPYVGPLRGEDNSLDLMLRRMGGTIPATGLIMPITVRDRVVALMVAHRIDRALTLPDIADVLSLDRQLSDALTRVIMRHKSVNPDESAARSRSEAAAVTTTQPTADLDQRSAAPTQLAHEPTPPADSRRVATAIPIISRGTDGLESPADFATRSLRAPTVRTDSVEFGTEVTLTADEPRTIDDILDDVMGNSADAAEDALQEAVERSAAMLPLINMRFPGRLRVERFAVAGRPLRAAQYGGLLELIVRMGADATELLIHKMAAPQRDIRFYATVCCVELRPKAAVGALVERLFDNDYGVRACAIEALSGYPLRDLEIAMISTRQALHSDDIDRVAAACHATAEIADVNAVTDLLAAMARGDRFADHARAALVWLSRQDFGTSERKWRRWWEDNKKRHRMEWLIDALGHKEDALRKAAIDDLRRLTGEYFGYHHDLAKKERDAAQARWQTWWKETGLRRFG